jgi:acyl-[acyl-carrier-protein]-phospholipid O-acyltransferase / long-chain-fatty-acid--[acyl-carrier-protein] ligase
LAGAFPQHGFRCEVAVVSLPDEERGEALVAVTNEPKVKLEDIRSVLREKGFANICLPREVRHLREIPKLGSGKLNHRGLEEKLRGG